MNRSRRLFWLLAAVLVVGVLAIYAQVRGFGLLTYDDRLYTESCPFVADGLSVANVLRAFRELAWVGIYMPITFVTYMADITLFGDSPGVHHVVPVVFHALNAVLLFVFLTKVVLRDADSRLAVFAAFAATAFWAGHPLRVESVAWVASRKDVLFTMFTLVGLLAWARGRRWAACPLMLLACLCKPTAMVFPALAAAVDFLQERRFTWKSCLPYVPLVVLSGATAALAAYSQTHHCAEGVAKLYETTLGWRLLNAAVSLGLYCWHLVVPVGLQYLYRPIKDGLPLHTVLGLVAAASAAAAYGLAWWRFGALRRALLATAFWFLASIGPTLGVLGTFGNSALADRFTYVPMMAVSVLAVLALKQVNFRPVGSVLLLLVSVGYGVGSYVYAQTFRTNKAAVENILAHDPGDADSWTDLGNDIVMNGGDVNRAVDCFRKAVSLNETVSTKTDLIVALMMRNDPKDEDEIVKHAMSLADWKTSPAEGVIPLIPEERDKQGVISRALGEIAVRHGDWRNALRCLGESHRRNPTEWTAVCLGECHLKLGETDAAKRWLEPLVRSQNAGLAQRAKTLLSKTQTR